MAQNKKSQPIHNQRLIVLQLTFSLVFMGIIARLFYWQILASSSLQAVASLQHASTIELPADRGLIYSNDGYPFITNQDAYLVYAYTPDIKDDGEYIAFQLKDLLAQTAEETGATPSAELAREYQAASFNRIRELFTNVDTSWIALKRKISREQKESIERLKIAGIGFEPYRVRDYPEASMAAQLVGFVGSDGAGHQKGYFGLEGFYNLELTGKSGLIVQEKDALGKPIMIGGYTSVASRDGRHLYTHLDRSLQVMVERELSDALEKYQAKAGEVVIMDPHTGAILAMASLPSYDPRNYKLYDQKIYPIPAIAEAYEPGSTFKVLIMAAAINEGVISPETRCNSACAGPVTIGKYTIRTWNNEYNPGQTMTDVLRHSDNTGMVHVAQQLGKDKTVQYIKDFGIGQATEIDLESEAIPQLRDKWGDIDIATASFGQGLATTSIQIARAVSAIANGGNVMIPQIVDKVGTGDVITDIQPVISRRVISQATAQTVALMMRAAAESGEAQWAVPKGYKIAGKTGTAQIAIDGHYDEEKTIASFVGFAPYDNPRFVMLVKLKEPQSSPWASETAAPLWFDLAKQIFVMMDIRS